MKNCTQCLFGEHLLNEKDIYGNLKPIAIVEAEKTAVIATPYIPEFIWLAAGSLNGLNIEKCSILKGRNITLFPDLDGFEKWSKIADQLSNIAQINVFDLLERKANNLDRKQKLDIADYLIRFPLQDFKNN